MRRATTPCKPRCGNLLRAALLSGAGTISSTACAHGFGQRYDLPVPLWLYLTGAAAAVAVSFVIMAAFGQRGSALANYSRIDLLRSRIGQAVARPWVLACYRVAAVALFLLVLVAGFFGHPAPVKNIAPLMVWAIWWVGMAYVSALLGNVWALINPLDTAFAWAASVYSRVRRGAALSLGVRYPPALAMWPAVALFFAFACAELVWEQSDVPANVATAMLVYCAITWTGMFIFGREIWLERGETFALIFALLARFAPLDVRAAKARCACNLRPYAVGLLVDEPVHPSQMVLVWLILATVTFDGFMETPLWTAIADGTRQWLSALAIRPADDDLRAVVATLGLAVFALSFLSVYVSCAWLIARCAGAGADAGGSPPTRYEAFRIARFFIFTLVPIAIGYHLAHYLSFLVMAGQYLIPLASDPLGLGWDLFGTTLYIVKIGIVDARFVWFASVTAIVIGHVAAVYLAHAMALRIFRDKRAALSSQYPMLALMIGYTMVSLWIIAQPIVNSRPG